MTTSNNSYARDFELNQCGHCGKLFDEPGAYCLECEDAKDECNKEVATND